MNAETKWYDRAVKVIATKMSNKRCLSNKGYTNIRGKTYWVLNVMGKPSQGDILKLHKELSAAGWPSACKVEVYEFGSMIIMCKD